MRTTSSSSFTARRNRGARSAALSAAFTRFAAIATILLATPGCLRQTRDDADPSAISNRPQSYDQFIAVLKLDTPALLVGAKKVGGAVAVDPDQKARLLAEQAAVEGALAQMSPEIKVLYRYRFVLNGLAILAPRALENEFKKIGGVSYVEREGSFAQPMLMEAAAARATARDIESKNSVSFIGGKRVHEELKVRTADGTEVPVKGAGIRIGVIDTGIDFTHAMFGGPGTKEAYEAIDPAVGEGVFPTTRVVGGVDLVGKTFDSGSAKFEHHIPVPDANPIDLRGHGSHVAGTIAGIGDGTNTYSGVAPDAELFAIKVFGDDGGSTSDSVVIAALEFAADPDSDLDPADALDVVNLSLGAGYGMPHVLYSEAVGNLAKGGTVTVASAGNSGATEYIVGAPSTAPAAISVAASIDDMDHNWKFDAVVFSTPENPRIIVEAIEAAISKPIKDAGAVAGKLVPIGLAHQDLTDAQKEAVRGNIAFIDRGAVTFAEKLQRAAAAGAIGIVVANNRDGEPIVMGGDGNVEIPAIMITNILGDAIKASIAAGGEARIDFVSDVKIEKPELIDNLTGFSSRGPRSVDSLIKPEISAPGQNIMSAKAGGGAEGVRFSGTSMAAPHVAGVTALLRQVHKGLDPATVKSLLTGTAKTIVDQKSVPYSVAHMGAGRVQAFHAATTTLVFEPATLSLGEVSVEKRKAVRRAVTVRNMSASPAKLSLKSETANGLDIKGDAAIELAPGASKTLTLLATISAPAETAVAAELDGFIKLTNEAGMEVARLPVLAVAKRTARVAVDHLKIFASSEADAAGAAGELKLSNKGATAGQALLFNLLGRDERKIGPKNNPARNSSCDVESAGYRVIKQDIDGVLSDVLQIAVKLFNPVTTWNLCEISVQIDTNGDGLAEQELLATDASLYVPGAAANTFRSVLVDAARMRSLRAQYELNFPAASEDYTESLLDVLPVQFFNHSTLAVVSANISQLAKTPNGDLRIKVGALSTDTTSPEADDFLKSGDGYQKIAPVEAGVAYADLPAVVDVKAGETVTVPVSRGGAKGSLVVYLPQNTSTLDDVQKDSQSRVVKPKFNP